MEMNYLENPTSPNDLRVSVSNGQPQYSFDLNKTTLVVSAVASLAVMSTQPLCITQNFDAFCFQSDIPAIELYIDNTNYRNVTAAEIVKSVLKFYGLGKMHLCAIAGISRPALYAWLDNSSMPDTKNFYKIQALYNIAQQIEHDSDEIILWSFLEKPINHVGKSLYDLFVQQSEIDTLEITNYVREAFKKSVTYKKSLDRWKKKSFTNKHSTAEQELNLEDNI